MITYKYMMTMNGDILTDSIKRSDGVFIPFDINNTDYKSYLKWLSEGNTPLPADQE
jgi:hypothetical protein